MAWHYPWSDPDCEIGDREMREICYAVRERLWAIGAAEDGGGYPAYQPLLTEDILESEMPSPDEETYDGEDFWDYVDRLRIWCQSFINQYHGSHPLIWGQFRNHGNQRKIWHDTPSGDLGDPSHDFETSDYWAHKTWKSGSPSVWAWPEPDPDDLTGPNAEPYAKWFEHIYSVLNDLLVVQKCCDGSSYNSNWTMYKGQITGHSGTGWFTEKDTLFSGGGILSQIWNSATGIVDWIGRYGRARITNCGEGVSPGDLCACTGSASKQCIYMLWGGCMHPDTPITFNYDDPNDTWGEFGYENIETVRWHATFYWTWPYNDAEEDTEGSPMIFPFPVTATLHRVNVDEYGESAGGIVQLAAVTKDPGSDPPLDPGYGTFPCSYISPEEGIGIGTGGINGFFESGMGLFSLKSSHTLAQIRTTPDNTDWSDPRAFGHHAYYERITMADWDADPQTFLTWQGRNCLLAEYKFRKR